MKNIDFLKHRVLQVMGTLTFFSVIVFSIFRQWPIVLSLILGFVFSALILSQLMQAQVVVLRQSNRSLYFKYFLLRLFYYIVPCSLGFYYYSLFNFPVLLLMLFANQGCYIIFMLIRSLKKIHIDK
ncbi:MAG: hypothetical protein VW378_06630 [bacterium]